MGAVTSIEGGKIVLTYSETLNTTTAGPSWFEVKVNGVVRTVTAVAVNGDKVELSLQAPITQGQSVTVSYTAPNADAGPSNNAVQDTAGHDAAGLDAQTVSVVLDVTPPTAKVVSTAITVVQLEALNRTDGSDQAPQITAVGASGEFVVTWYGADSAGDNSIFVQKFNANGTTSGSTVQLEALNRADGGDEFPQITAVGTSGAYVVTWTGQDSQLDTSIFVQKFNADGTTSGSTVQLEALNNTRRSEKAPQITAVGDLGAYVVTWFGYDSQNKNNVYVQKFNADNTISGETVRLYVPDAPVAINQSPQITAVGSTGAFVVTWCGWDSERDDSIFVQKFNADGTTTGNTLVQLEAMFWTRGSDVAPQITAVGSSDEYVLTWQGHDRDSMHDWSIFVQKFNANGTTHGSTVQLEALNEPDGQDTTPQITALGSSGAFVVTWYCLKTDFDYSIFVQKFNANGSVSGNMVKLDALGSDQQPQITAVGSAGEYVVTWRGQDSGGDASIFVQKFNANGTVSGSVVQLEAQGQTNGHDQAPQITAVGSTGEFVVTWHGTDSAGDNSIFVQKFGADGLPLQPSVTINASTADPANVTVPVQSTESGTAYLVHSSINMAAGLAALTSDNESQWNSQAIITANTTVNMATTGLVDGEYRLYTADAVGNLSQAVNKVLEIDREAPTYTPGQEVISLGDMGQLMLPVHVDGKWYYLWDLNGDSAINDDENTNGKYDRDGAEYNPAGVGYQFDALNHSVLDALFVKDANGNTENANNPVGDLGETDHTFHFAQIAGVNLALPTLGHGGTQVSADGYGGVSTSVDNSTPGQNNPSFDDLFAIWDAHNGSDDGLSGISGLPSAWADGYYWSATPTEAGFHAAIYFSTGDAFEFSALQAFTVVQVL